MSKYIMKPISDTTWSIWLSRQKVGFVRRIPNGINGGKFIARINDHEPIIRDDKSEAFHEAVAVENRIALVGRNDAKAAKEALDKRNQSVRSEADRLNRELNDAGLPSLFKVRTRRFSI